MRCSQPWQQVPSSTPKLLTTSLLLLILNPTRLFSVKVKTSLQQTGVPLPRIRISLRDSLLRKSPPVTGLIITASCDRLERTKLANAIVGMIDGVATFDSLTFVGVQESEDVPFVLTFTAGNQGKYPVENDQIRTGIVMVGNSVRPGQSVRFLQSSLDSSITEEYQAVQAVVFQYLLPVRIELLDTSNTRDVASSLSITVKAVDGNVEDDNSVTKFVKGVATFSSIRFSSSSTSRTRLKFTTSGNASLPANGAAVVSGVINATSVINNFEMRFQPYGASTFSSSSVSAFATVNYALPPIVIELLNSGKQVDTTSNDIGITAACDGATLSNSFMRVTNGIAVFRNLMFVSETAGTFKITFTAGKEGNAPVAGKSIVSGSIDVVLAYTPNYGIMFTNESYISFQGAIKPFTLGEVLPPIYIRLTSSTGTYGTNTATSTSVAVDVQLSSGQFSADSVTTAEVVSGLATFDRIIIVDAFDPILTFCARSTKVSSDSSVEGRCIKSGSMIAVSTVSNVGGIVVLNSTCSPHDHRCGVQRPVANPGTSFSVPENHSCCCRLARVLRQFLRPQLT